MTSEQKTSPIRRSLAPARRSLVALLLSVLATAATAAPDQDSIRAVHCIPLGSGSLNPVWMSDIWTYECGSGHPERHQQAWNQLSRLAKSGESRGAFRNGDVRLAMRAGQARIYLDANLNGLMIDKAGWRFFTVPRASDLATELMFVFDGDDYRERLAPGE